MQTLVLRIPDDLAADLQAEARRRNSTKSEVARARLAAARSPASEGGAGFALIADLIGADAGQPRDLSARKKHYLKARGYGRYRLRDRPCLLPFAADSWPILHPSNFILSQNDSHGGTGNTEGRE